MHAQVDVESDHDMCTRLRISHALIASAIGISRQAVFAGLKGRSRYLRDDHLPAIRSALFAKQPELIREFDAFIQRTRPHLRVDIGFAAAPDSAIPSSAASNELSATGALRSIEGAAQIWVVVPDWDELVRYELKNARLILNLADSKRGSFKLFTASDEDAGEFWRAYARHFESHYTDEEKSIATKVSTFVTALPFMIITNPEPVNLLQSERGLGTEEFSAYVLVEGRFHALALLRGRAIYRKLNAS